MGNISIDVLRCKGCGRCIEACPKQLISLSPDLNDAGYHYVDFDDHADDCNGCSLCATSCPDQGIEAWNSKGRQTWANTSGLTETVTHYCPGCTHGNIHRMVADVLDELGLLGRTVGVAPVGCAVLAYKYFAMDMLQAPHGRAPAMATGAKRSRPDSIVFTYQGDGDLASIGGNEILHAANRGEKITVIFVNNAIYGMTGGQMAPTTLPDQRTTTSPYGRDVAETGFPMRVSELLATLQTPAYIARGSSHDAKHIRATRRYIKKAFELQAKGACFSFVEILSTCPTNWGLSPMEASQWLCDNMIPYYPLGVVKEPTKVKTAAKDAVLV